MYPRTEYEMTEADLAELMEAFKPVPMIMLQCGNPPSQQENANRAWVALGKKMGFDGDTVRPINGKGNRFFSAIPSETESARSERLEKEAIAKKQENIKRLETEISDLQKKLSDILAA